MKDFVILIIATCVWWAVWSRLAKVFKAKGYKGFVTHGSAGLAGLAVAAIVLVILIDKPEQKVSAAAVQPNTAAEITTSTETADLKKNNEVTLGLTVAQYTRRLNSQLEEAEMLVRVPKNPDVLKGQVNDSVMLDLGERIKVIAALKKDSGELISVMMISESDGTSSNALDILVSSVCVLRAAVVDPKQNEQVGPTIKKLMLKDKGDETSASETLGNVKLFHNRSKLTGIWFGAEAI
jgi:hypothetical protein